MGVVQLKLAARIRAAEPGAGAKTRLTKTKNTLPPGGTPRGSAMGVVNRKCIPLQPEACSKLPSS
jgi:hypothetical protein